MTYFDSFDQAVLAELRKALNASPTMSVEMTRLLSAVVFREFEIGGPNDAKRSRRETSP